jgi:hypothetical protein
MKITGDGSTLAAGALEQPLHRLQLAWTDRAGLGIAVLPAFPQTCVPDLQLLSASIAALETPLWLITHPELKNTTRALVLMRALGPALANFIGTPQEALRCP